MTFLRNLLVYLAIVGMIQMPIPAVSHAEAAPTLRGEEIDSILEKLPRVHHDERVITMFDRLVPHMSEFMRVQMIDIGLGDDWWQMPTPDFVIKDRTVTFGEGQHQFVIKVEELPKGIGVSLNGTKLEASEFKNIKELTARVKKIMKVDAKKSALWSVMVPEARALDFMSGLLGVGVGVLGMMLWNKWSESKQQAAAPAIAPVCSTAQCCVISNQSGGQYVAASAPYCCVGVAQANPDSSVYSAGMVDSRCNGPYPPVQAAYNPYQTNNTGATPMLKSQEAQALPAKAKASATMKPQYKAAPVTKKKTSGQN